MSRNHNNIVDAAEDLIREHFELEPMLEQVVWIDSDRAAEIRLLDVNPQTFPTGTVLSFYFPPDEELPFATHIAEITPDEWERVLRSEVHLPEGWTLKNHKVYSREAIAI